MDIWMGQSEIWRMMRGETSDICKINVGACGVMVIFVGNGHGDTSLNPGWG